MFLGLFLVLLELAFIAFLIFIGCAIIFYAVAFVVGSGLLGTHSLIKATNKKEPENPEDKLSHELTMRNVAIYCVVKKQISIPEVSKFFDIKYSEAKTILDSLAQYKIIKDNGPLRPYEAMMNDIYEKTPLPEMPNKEQGESTKELSKFRINNTNTMQKIEEQDVLRIGRGE